MLKRREVLAELLLGSQTATGTRLGESWLGAQLAGADADGQRSAFRVLGGKGRTGKNEMPDRNKSRQATRFDAVVN